MRPREIVPGNIWLAFGELSRLTVTHEIRECMSTDSHGMPGRNEARIRADVTSPNEDTLDYQ